jgi:hypothetical protein
MKWVAVFLHLCVPELLLEGERTNTARDQLAGF